MNEQELAADDEEFKNAYKTLKEIINAVWNYFFNFLNKSAQNCNFLEFNIPIFHSLKITTSTLSYNHLLKSSSFVKEAASTAERHQLVEKINNYL